MGFFAPVNTSKENKKRKCKSHLLLHIKDAFLKVQKILTIIITVKAHDL